jgi:hypothetical protein
MLCPQRASELVPQSGRVVYLRVPGMGKDKVRPCVVLFQWRSDLWLLPLSSDTWRPTENPVVHFNGGMSFAVLDRVFALPAAKCSVNSVKHISGRAVRCCIGSLKRAIEAGGIFAPGLKSLIHSGLLRTELA